MIRKWCLVDLAILPDHPLASPLPSATFCLFPPILSTCSEPPFSLASHSAIACAYLIDELNQVGKDVYVYLHEFCYLLHFSFFTSPNPNLVPPANVFYKDRGYCER
jgi:hypothetical protein